MCAEARYFTCIICFHRFKPSEAISCGFLLVVCGKRFYSCCLLHVAFCFLCVEKQGVLLVLRRGFKLPSQVLSCQVTSLLKLPLKPLLKPPFKPLEKPPSSPIEKPALLKPLQAPVQPFNLLPSRGLLKPLQEAPPSQAPLRRTMMEHAPQERSAQEDRRFYCLRGASSFLLKFSLVKSP